MRVVSFRYPRNAVTDILLCIIFSFLIILLVTSGERVGKVECNSPSLDVASEFLSSFGWSVNDSSVICETVMISKDSGEVFSDYNELQKEQGFDLLPYCGKEVIKCTYEVLNFPGYENKDGIYSTVYMYDGLIIAADIYSAAIDGFIQGVKNNG
ncbi:MAG: DUF4830 domain-containing protein [Clostridia bacterium]|nr:DUF4830 domain-containing protein [Clostridia bacterium]